MRNKPFWRTIFVVLGLGVAVYASALPAATVSIIATVPGLSGIATDRDGNIYALSATNNSILHFSATGELLGTIGPTLPNGHSLKISQFSNPIHVDTSGKIYLPSSGRILILDNAGTVLNVDSNGQLLTGFNYSGFIRWIGVSRTGNIYVHPAIDDESSLITVLTPTGQHLASFGDILLPRDRPPYNLFHMALGEDDTLYAVFSLFPKMMRYRPNYKFDGLFTLAMPHLAPKPSDLPLEEMLQRLSDNKPLPENTTIVVQAAESIGDQILCLSGMRLYGYGSFGELLGTSELDYQDYKGIITKIVSGCRGQCLIGMSQTRDIIYRIDY